MSEQEDIFDESIESLEYSELKDAHQVIPPISSFSRGSDVVEEGFQSAASNYYGSNTANRNASSPSMESSGPFNPVQSRVTAVSSSDNVITAAHHILGNVANFVTSSSPSPSSASSIYASVTTQGSSLTSSQNDWTLPSVSVSLPSATQNTTMAVESPQLHAALTMTCLTTQNAGLADAYSNILHQPGLHNTTQQGNLLGFSPSVIPVAINSSNTPLHGTQTIESANQRSHANKIHETIGAHSHEKAMVELEKHRNFLNNIQQQQQPQQSHVLPVAISVDTNAFMNSSLPTAGTVAPPNTQLPPSLSVHSRPAEAGLPTRSAASHVDSSNHPTPMNINVDTAVQQGEIQVTVDGDTGNRRQGKKARSKRNVPTEEKDDRYFERRKRNNQAAKRSRDARKVREEHISRRADFLERENEILKAQLSTLREEANSLRLLLSQRPVIPTMITSQGHQLQ